jgi:DNA ligase (NAD+)
MDFASRIPDHDIPSDGLVLSYNDIAYGKSLGTTAKFPRDAIAFKWADELAETKLLEVFWSPSRTGLINPVAIFDTVELEGTSVSRASIHNVSIARQLKLGIGDTIKVYKANMIIPQIIRGECRIPMNGDEIVLDFPGTCPVCGGPTYLQDGFVYCDNPHCEGKFINKLEHFCGKKGLDIKGLSEATLQKLVDWGWVGNYQELFSLSNFHNEWVEQPGFGPKSVDKLLATIDEARNCELWQFIASLSIPLIGTTYAKEIAKRCKDWFSFRECIEKNYDFTTWDRFGYEINDSIHNFDYKEADDLAYKVLTIHNSLWIDPTATVSTVKFSEVAGKTFVITGSVHTFKNRDEVKVAIETRGGKVTGSVSKNTNYLVNNDINSTSSKNVKAKQLGIPIITEEQLIAML